MGDQTSIEWTDKTFNPWWGCSRVSPACRFCYADRDAQRYGHQVWRRHGPRRMLSEANWQRPLKWNRDAAVVGVPAKVFCASMADVFEDHPDVAAPRERLWELIDATPHLIWQLLSKRPENIAQMVPWGKNGRNWPANVWMGTSVENDPWAGIRIPLLLKNTVGARVLFLSCEPLLGDVDLRPWLFPEPKGCNCGSPLGVYPHEPGCGLEPPLIDWVICGGESGPKARPMSPLWARSLRDQCVRAGVPFFFKQHGEWAPTGQVGIGCIDSRERLIGQPDERGFREVIRRVGKKAAGRQLDGRTWDQFPESSLAAAA